MKGWLRFIVATLIALTPMLVVIGLTFVPMKVYTGVFVAAAMCTGALLGIVAYLELKG